MIQLDKREAFPFSSNPFGLVYENAITENKENEVVQSVEQTDCIKCTKKRNILRESLATLMGGNVIL